MRIKSAAASLLLSVAAPGMAPLPADAMDGTAVQVPFDIDVYDQPGGEGKKRTQFLNGGSEVILLEERADHWCNVQFDKGGTGWIWCGVGDDGRTYAVKKIPVDEINTPEPDQGGGVGGGGAGGGGPAGE